jgi:hypothetical protein
MCIISLIKGDGLHYACFDDPGHLDIDYDLHDIADESTSRSSHLDAGVDETNDSYRKREIMGASRSARPRE